MDVEHPQDFKRLWFGRHKGLTWQQVCKMSPSYVWWAINAGIISESRFTKIFLENLRHQLSKLAKWEARKRRSQTTNGWLDERVTLNPYPLPSDRRPDHG